MKKTKRTLLTLIMAFGITTSLPVCVQAAEYVPVTATETQVEPRADILVWRYKSENNKLYRRLYNATKQEWAGEWELCP